MPSPRNDDAPVLAGTWGAGSVVVTLHSYKKNTTRKSPQRPAVKRRRVRLFLGATAPTKAAAWSALHGPDAALALLDDGDPVDVAWPIGALVQVVQEEPEPFARLSALAYAMRQAGVFYAAIPHHPEWPNLWPAMGEGGAP